MKMLSPVTVGHFDTEPTIRGWGWNARKSVKATSFEVDWRKHKVPLSRSVDSPKGIRHAGGRSFHERLTTSYGYPEDRLAEINRVTSGFGFEMRIKHPAFHHVPHMSPKYLHAPVETSDESGHTVVVRRMRTSHNKPVDAYRRRTVETATKHRTTLDELSRLLPTMSSTVDSVAFAAARGFSEALGTVCRYDPPSTMDGIESSRTVPQLRATLWSQLIGSSGESRRRH